MAHKRIHKSLPSRKRTVRLLESFSVIAFSEKLMVLKRKYLASLSLVVLALSRILRTVLAVTDLTYHLIELMLRHSVI